MNILIGALYVIEVLVCLLLALVVLLQKPKEGGLGGAIAGGMGEAVFGADAGNVLIKATSWLGAIFLANTLLLARFTSTVHAKTLMQDEAEPAAVEQQMPEMPQMPAPAPAPVPAAEPVKAAEAPAPAAAEAPAAPAKAETPAAPAAPAKAETPAAAPAAADKK